MYKILEKNLRKSFLNCTLLPLEFNLKIPKKTQNNIFSLYFFKFNYWLYNFYGDLEFILKSIFK